MKSEKNHENNPADYCCGKIRIKHLQDTINFNIILPSTFPIAFLAVFQINCVNILSGPCVLRFPDHSILLNWMTLITLGETKKILRLIIIHISTLLLIHGSCVCYSSYKVNKEVIKYVREFGYERLICKNS